MKHPIRHRRFAALAVGIVALLALVFAAPSSAKRIYKSVPTHVAFSATRAADGTVTAKVLFTSPNPKCLSADRWKKTSDGYSHDAEAWLHYPTASPSDTEDYAEPNNGLIGPVSPAGHSPYVFQVIWPGSMVVKVHASPINAPYYTYTSTVSAAINVAVYGYAPPSHLKSYYEYAYNQGGNRIILKCQTTPNGGNGAGKVFVF